MQLMLLVVTSLSCPSLLMHMISSLLDSRFLCCHATLLPTVGRSVAWRLKKRLCSRLHDFLLSLKRKGRDFLQHGDEEMELQSDPLMSIHLLLWFFCIHCKILKYSVYFFSIIVVDWIIRIASYHAVSR